MTDSGKMEEKVDWHSTTIVSPPLIVLLLAEDQTGAGEMQGVARREHKTSQEHRVSTRALRDPTCQASADQISAQIRGGASRNFKPVPSAGIAAPASSANTSPPQINRAISSPEPDHVASSSQTPISNSTVQQKEANLKKRSPSAHPRPRAGRT